MRQSIEKMLVISTAHIKDTTDTLLRGDETSAIVYPHGEYGYLIHVPSELRGWMVLMRIKEKPLPEELCECMVHAYGLGCCWLLLDRDARTIGELPTFEW